MKAIFLSLIFLTSTFSYATPWVRFTCELQSDDGATVDSSQKIIVEIGQVEDGWPLESLLVNDKDQKSNLTQFQFEIQQVQDINQITGHLVWLEKVPAEEGSELAENRILTVAKMKTKVTVADQVKTSEYVMTSKSTNVDDPNGNISQKLKNYKCLEPELL